jgi:hypothetical protein
MPTRKLFAILALIPFTLLSVLAVMQFGYIGIVENLLRNSAGWQALADLVIALLLVFAWMIPEARARGRNPWPWVVITLVLGSFGPLLYLATEKSSAE